MFPSSQPLRGSWSGHPQFGTCAARLSKTTWLRCVSGLNSPHLPHKKSWRGIGQTSFTVGQFSQKRAQRKFNLRVPPLRDVGGEKVLNPVSPSSYDANRLFTIPQVADRLQVSEDSVYRAIKSGRLRAVYPTSRARVSERSLSNYIAMLEAEEVSTRNKFGRGA